MRRPAQGTTPHTTLRHALRVLAVVCVALFLCFGLDAVAQGKRPAKPAPKKPAISRPAPPPQKKATTKRKPPTSAKATTAASKGKTKAALEAERARLQAQITRTQEQLKGVQAEKTASLEALSTLQEQITTRRQVIGVFSQEIQTIDRQVGDSKEQITSLSDELIRLKEGYARLVRYAYRNRAGYQKFVFLFSASSFNQAWARFQYLVQYTRYRRRQVAEIQATQVAIASRITELQRFAKAKKEIMGEQRVQQQRLQGDANLREQVVGKLQRDEDVLASDLREQRATANRLETAIEAVVARAARTAAAASPTTRSGSTATDAVLSSSFVKNKRRLPWPVAGRISESFGVHAHPVLRGVSTRNDGVNIRAESAGPVKAVFDGEVTGVVTVPGMQHVIIVRHGEYLTVYAHLEATGVGMGAKVRTGQPLGMLHRDAGARAYELHFELWKGTTKLDPATWLR